MVEVMFVNITAPSFDCAKQIASKLVNARVAACVSIVPQVYSMYRWQGNIEESNECLMILKAQVKAFEQIEMLVKENHPYECPEIVAFPISAGSKSYLEWICNETL